MLGLGLHSAKHSVVSTSVEAIMASDPRVWYNENSLLPSIGQYADSYIDQSGNSFNIEQPNTAKQPQVIDGGSGKKALLFTNDFFFNGDHPVLSGSDDFTVLYAGSQLSRFNWALYIGDDDEPAGGNSKIFMSTSNTKLQAWVGQSLTTFNSLVFGTNQSNGGNDIAFAYKRGTDSSDVYFGIDNGNSSKEAQYPWSHPLELGDGIGFSSINPDDPAAGGGGSGWFLYEVLVYNRALTKTELAQTRQYLREKWNV